MTARVRGITFDCADPYALAGFWSQLTGYREDPDDPNQPDDPEVLPVAPDGSGWVVLADPEGNEFCVSA